MYLKHIVKYYKDLVRLKFNSDGNSRFGEQILQNIKRGVYVDIGCYHPVKESHTAILYKNCWSGVNLDISKDTIEMFNIFIQSNLLFISFLISLLTPLIIIFLYSLRSSFK